MSSTVSLRVDSSTAYLYGTLIRMFMHVKENLFGEDQHFTPMDIVTNSSTDVYKSSLKLDPSNHSSEDFDPRLYRYAKFSNFDVKIILPSTEQNYLILENKSKTMLVFSRIFLLISINFVVTLRDYKY